jgi:hypothetical protein
MFSYVWVEVQYVWIVFKYKYYFSTEAFIVGIVTANCVKFYNLENSQFKLIPEKKFIISKGLLLAESFKVYIHNVHFDATLYKNRHRCKLFSK